MSQSLQGDTGNDQHPKPSPVAWLREAIVARSSSTTSSSAGGGGAQVARNSSLGGGSASAGSDSNDTDSLCRSASWASTTPTSPGASTAALRAMAAQEEPPPPIPTVQSHFGKEWDTDYSIGSPQAGVASLLPLKLGDVPIAPARETSLPNSRSPRRRSSSENVELGLTPPGRSRSASVTDQDGSGSGSGSGTGTSPNSFNTAGEVSPIVPFTAPAAEASSASLVATNSGEQDPARSQSSLASSNATYAARLPLNLHKPLPPPGKASPVLEADNESHTQSQNIPLLSLSPAHGPTWSFDPYAELRTGDMPASGSNVSSPGLSTPLSASEQGHPWGDSPPGSASSQLRSAITKSGRRIRKSFLWSGGSNGDGSSEAPKSSSLSPADRSAGSSRWTSPSSSRAPSPSISPQSSEMNVARSASPRPTAYSLDSPLHAGPSRSNSYLERQLRRDRLTTSTDSDATLLARQHLGTAAKSEAEVFHTPESVVEESEYPWNSSTLRQSSPSSSRRLSNLFLQQLDRDLPPLPTSPSSTRAHSNVEPMVPVRPSLAGGSKLHAARSVQDLQLSYAGHRAQEEVEPVALVAAQHARQKRSWAGSLREKSTRRTSSSAALGSVSSTDLADGATGASGGEKKGSAWSRMKVRPRSSHDALKTLSTHHGTASTSSYFTHTDEAYTQPYEGEYHAPNTTFSRVARSFRSRMTPLDAGGVTPRSEVVPTAGQTPRARQVSGGSAVSLMDLSPMTPRTEAPDSPISPGLRDLAAAQLSIDLAELPSDDDALFVNARERHSRSGSEATGTTDTSGTLHTCADYSDGGEGVLDVDKTTERAPQPLQEAQPKRANRRHSFGRALSSVWTARHGAHPNASAAVEVVHSPARSDVESRASAQSDRTELPSRPGTSMGFSSRRTSGTGDEDDEHVPAPHRSRIPRIPSGLTMTAAARAAPPTSFRHPPSADEASGVASGVEQSGVKLPSKGTASASEATPQQPQRKKRRHVRSSSASSYIVATMRGGEAGTQEQVQVIAPPRSSSQAARRISFGSGAPASTNARKSKNKAREPSSAESDADKPALWINTHAVPNASDASSAGEGDAGRSAGSASAGAGGQPALSIVDDSEFLRALEQVRALHLSALARAHATSDRLERMAKMGMAPALRRERASGTGEGSGSRGSAKRSSSADARLERLRDEGEEEERDALLPLLDTHDTLPTTAGSGLQREGSIARRPHETAAGGVGSAVASSDEDWKMEVKSLFVIRELVQTELSYQRHLESLLSAVRSMPTTTPTSDFSSRLRRKSYNGLSSSFSNTLSPSKAGNAALSSINGTGSSSSTGASTSSTSSPSSAGLASQAAHLRTLRKLLPPLIALSRNLSTRITRDPTAGGVGAAFRAVAPQLEAVFVAWNAQAAEMMDGLRHSEGPKGRARDRIGLVPLLVELGSSAAAPGAAKKEARSSSSSFAPSSSAKRGRAMDALALTRPSSPTHGVAPQRRERKGSDVPSVQTAGGSVSPASPRMSLPASRQRRRSTVSALDFDAVPAFGAHAKESSSHSSSATLEAPRTRPASSAAVASLGKRAMSAVARKSGATSEGPSPASPTAASAFLPRSSSAVPFADSPVSSPLGVRAAHPAPTTAQRKKQLGALDIAIMPTQRVPRYLLLLRDLLSNTPARSVAHARVGQAIESLLLVARACDDSAQMRQQAGEERAGIKGRQNGLAQPAGGSTASASTRTLTTARSAGALSNGRKTSPASAAMTTTTMPRLKAQPVQSNSSATFGSTTTTTAAQRAASLSPAPQRNGSAMGG